MEKIIIFEFNIISQNYIKLLKKLNITKLIDKIHFPFNVRIKYPLLNKLNLKRKHPTELMHADGWTGAAPTWIAAHLFIMGDIKKNNIRYAYPNNNFKEEWLSPKIKSANCKNIVKNFKIINYTPRKGKMILADNCIIHQSFRKKKCGYRISIDTGFDTNNSELKNSYKRKLKNKNFDVEKLRNKEEFWKRRFKNRKRHNMLFS